MSSRSAVKSRGCVVGQLHEPDDAPCGDEWHGELRLVSPLLEGDPARFRKLGVIQARRYADLGRADGLPALRIPVEGHDDAFPLRVEPPSVVAYEGAQRFALERVDIGYRRVADFGQAFGDRVQNVLRAQ